MKRIRGEERPENKIAKTVKGKENEKGNKRREGWAGRPAIYLR